MYLFVGLGNPGLKYKLTRHNAGFLVVDEIARKYGIDWGKKGFHSIYGRGKILDWDVILAKPQTYMNLSGQALVELVNYYKIDLKQMLVISDDMDLPLGNIRLKQSGSSGGHKGLASIIDLLGTNQFTRLRIGIGKPAVIPVIDFVLTPFDKEEKPVLKSVITTGADAAINFMIQGPELTMNKFNGAVAKLRAPVTSPPPPQSDPLP